MKTVAMAYGYGLYIGYDMRFRGCRAILKITGESTVLAQFDEVQEDPVYREGVTTKADDPKYINHTGPLPEPVSFCFGWHPFKKKDFSITEGE